MENKCFLMLREQHTYMLEETSYVVYKINLQRHTPTGTFCCCLLSGTIFSSGRMVSDGFTSKSNINTYFFTLSYNFCFIKEIGYLKTCCIVNALRFSSNLFSCDCINTVTSRTLLYMNSNVLINKLNKITLYKQ